MIKTLYITIIFSRLSISNKKGMFISNRKQLNVEVYEISSRISDFEEKLSHIILSHKGDGLDLNIYSSKNGTYVDIDLLVGEEDNVPNVDYIHNFLEPFQSKMGKPQKIDRLANFENYIYIQCSSPDELKSLVRRLEKENIDVEIISESRKTFEQGAGSYFIAYIIGIASSASWSIGKRVLKEMRSKHDLDFMKVQMESIDIKSLKKNISRDTGINEQDLDLISFEEIGNTKGNYEVWLRNRYKTVCVNSNTQGCISYLKVYEKYKTQI